MTYIYKMKEHFLKKALLIILMSFATIANAQENNNKELYELRTYDIKTGADVGILTTYIENVLKHTLKRKGVNHMKLFKEFGNSDPTKLWLLISYPNANIYMNSQELHKDSLYLKESASYNQVNINDKLFYRNESMLLLAFDALPKMDDIENDSSLFELRTYESYSEDANARKIKMFNEEELSLFYEVGLHPVFFGDQIAGQNRPCLTYMIQFKDMEEHDANWKKFINSPKWNKMASKKEYANTATKIHKVFLTPY
tara:strand:- start:2162 stop:2929 length:768 start_codon:yes stop_codon:yes gene_type:complete